MTLLCSIWYNYNKPLVRFWPYTTLDRWLFSVPRVKHKGHLWAQIHKWVYGEWWPISFAAPVPDECGDANWSRHRKGSHVTATWQVRPIGTQLFPGPGAAAEKYGHSVLGPGRRTLPYNFSQEDSQQHVRSTIHYGRLTWSGAAGDIASPPTLTREEHTTWEWSIT